MELYCATTWLRGLIRQSIFGNKIVCRVCRGTVPSIPLS